MHLREGGGRNQFRYSRLSIAVIALTWTVGVAARPAEAAEQTEWSAFERPVRPPIPQVDEPRWNHNPVDAFIKQTLDSRGLTAAPRADKRTLIRRAYLDLTGLLPAADEVDAFLANNSADAFSKLVDRLLDSPRYGERWGRHWLDTVRYADSGGYEFDYDYPNAWRYRDYVIRSFNDDKPYNRFVLEQLAGDELDEVTFESLTATGFNRVGPTVGYREKDNPQYRYEYLDDMIATASQTFMALTVHCARCHNHKFDPIEQMDYYRMMAIFFPYINFDYPLASPAEIANHESQEAEIRARIDPLKRRIAEIERPAKEAAFEQKLNTFSDDIQRAVRTPEAERTAGQKLLAAQVRAIGGDPEAVRGALSREELVEIDHLRQQIKQYETQRPQPLARAMGIRDGDYRFAPDGQGDEALPGKGNREVYDVVGSFLPVPGQPYEPPPTHFLPNGSYLEKGEVVEPGFPEFLTCGDPPIAHQPNNQHITSGRRRALAEWLTSESHPLTARVMVNRIWQHHFGRGIISTPNNFGFMSRPPSHPQLLDWLAVEFIDQNWSIKQLHRLIMNSQAYQMASDYHSHAHANIDPNNQFLYRYPQRRLEAEAIRDNVLSVSGNLRLQLGGPPFFPPLPEKVRTTEFYGRWDLCEDGPQVWRRSVYSYYRRGLRFPMFEVFDQPDPNVSCERRDVSTVPTQALFLLNNQFVLRQSRHFAERILRESGSHHDDQIRAAYRIALSRLPSETELQWNRDFLRRQQEAHTQSENEDPALDALTDFCHVVLNLNEFVYIN